jgi:hypothetical protein
VGQQRQHHDRRHGNGKQQFWGGAGACGWHGSSPPEQPGRAYEQDRGRDQVEHGKLDLGEELDARVCARS